MADESGATVIIGARDKGFAKASDMMHARIKGSQLVLVAEAGHMANEQQPAVFNASLRRFVSEHSAARL